jgi:regulatory protein YycH of two-component signal transduction system YycFG
MHSFDFRSLLLIPLVLAIAFMVWVFWNFGKDYNRH